MPTDPGQFQQVREAPENKAGGSGDTIPISRECVWVVPFSARRGEPRRLPSSQPTALDFHRYISGISPIAPGSGLMTVPFGLHSRAGLMGQGPIRTTSSASRGGMAHTLAQKKLSLRTVGQPPPAAIRAVGQP
jgi:hypothetical protein